MRLLVDGDGCPDIADMKNLAKKYDIPMIVYIDYAHQLHDDYFQTIYCEVGNDSVDMRLFNDSQKDDLVITQDYGLASLLISKNVQVMHISGKTLDKDNIDFYINSRYQSAKARHSHAKTHLKGPKKKRTAQTTNNFIKNLNRKLRNKT
ncbi:MAG: DUF188 domain-containing protein [Erysipelotrichaceae bacterium]|nr:DUF188 domain-containing protein [Erysipelotrichaceae bacterium]